MSFPYLEMKWPQLQLAAQVGVMRRLSAIFAGRERRGGKDDTGDYDTDVISCQAEFAVSLYLNLNWGGAIGNIYAKDVGDLVQVRAIRKKHHKLLLHPEDKDQDPFVLVYCQPPRFYFVGWCFAEKGKNKSYWEDPKGNMPAFFAPQSILDPIDTLRLIVNQMVREAA